MGRTDDGTDLADWEPNSQGRRQPYSHAFSVVRINPNSTKERARRWQGY